MPGEHTFHHLPLRKLGFDNVPAVPVDIPGMADTPVSLDDPRQWSMSWATLPDVYRIGLPHLDEWAATVDVAQPEAATEAFFPTIARYGRSYNLFLPRKVQGACAGHAAAAWGGESDG